MPRPGRSPGRRSGSPVAWIRASLRHRRETASGWPISEGPGDLLRSGSASSRQGTDQRLAEAKDWSYVSLSQDGSTVAFSSDVRIGSAVYSVPAAGGIPKKICAACGRPVEWSADRTKILLDNAGPEHREIQVLDVASGQTKPLLKHSEFALNMPRLSPDGRLLTFSALRPGRARRIYLVPFTGEPVPEKDWTVLVDGSDLDRQPFWGPSGNLDLLHVRSGWLAVHLGPARGHVEPSTPRRPVCRAPHAHVPLQPERHRRSGRSRAVGGQRPVVLCELRVAVEHLAGRAASAVAAIASRVALQHSARLDRVDVLQPPEDDEPVRDGGRGHQDLADRILGELFVLSAGFDHVDIAVFARAVDLAVRRDG